MSVPGPPFRVGLVGAGMVATHHIEGWRAQADARIVAVADPDIDRARSRAAALGPAAAYPSLAALLAVAALDAVDIVAPVDAHAALIEEAVAAGLPVMCQKPLTPTVAEGEALVARLPRAARVMVHENWRWRAPYRRLKALLDSGRVDRPRRFALSVTSAGLLADAAGAYPALARQPFFADMPRFLVFEVLLHHLDLLAYLFGPVTIHDAGLQRRSGRTRGEDTAHIRLTAGGVPGTVHGSLAEPGAPPLPKDRLVLEGGAGIVIDGWSITAPDALRQAWPPEAAYQDSYTAAIAHFREATRSGEAYETGLAEALAGLRAVEAVYAGRTSNGLDQ